MVNVGIIGCGSISRFHHEGYARAGSKIVHVCDIAAEAAQKVGALYGARVSTDYRHVLADPQVQLVGVTTVSAAHRDICLAAIAAGKGVVCEKTLADTAGAAAEIAHAAEKAGSFFATAYMKRFFPAAQQAKRLLADMGPIISMHARSWQPWDLWNGPVPEFLATRPSMVMSRYGGGTLVCAGSHVLDLVHWFGGRPSRLCGEMHFREGMDVDIRAGSMMWLEGGGSVHFEVCWHPLRFGGYERNGWDERLEINTVGGRLDLYTVRWDQSERNGALLVHQDAESGRTIEYRYPAQNAFDLEMAEMVRRFEAREPGFPSARDGYVVDEVIEAITAAAKSGNVVPLKWKA